MSDSLQKTLFVKSCRADAGEMRAPDVSQRPTDRRNVKSGSVCREMAAGDTTVGSTRIPGYVSRAFRPPSIASSESQRFITFPPPAGPSRPLSTRPRPTCNGRLLREGHVSPGVVVATEGLDVACRDLGDRPEITLVTSSALVIDWCRRP